MGLWKDVLAAVFMGMVLPGVMLNGAVMLREEPEIQATQAVAAPAEEPVNMPVRLGRADGVAVEDMDTYLVGVLLGEMPASFETEALRAQAVAARTYAWKAYITGGKHGDGSVCLESGCCQAWLPEEAYLAQGGTQEGLEKIRSAVRATSGWVLMYEGELIEATYFSCSGGSTEDAVAVWGTEFPYLQAVDSPGEEEAAHHRDSLRFTAGEFQRILGRRLEGPPESWFGQASYTDGGGVETIQIGVEDYTGTRLRSLLGLRSTAFTVTVEENVITFATRGYGHRVGMSQYGADAMAAAGSSYDQILAHYYPGTELVRWADTGYTPG